MPFLLASSEKLYVFKTPWFTGFWSCWKLLKARNVHACADTWLLRYLSITWLRNLRNLFHLNFLHTLSWPMHNQQFLPSNLCYWRKKKQILRFRSLDKSFFTPFFKLIYSFWGSRLVGMPIFFIEVRKLLNPSPLWC